MKIGETNRTTQHRANTNCAHQPDIAAQLALPVDDAKMRTLATCRKCGAKLYRTYHEWACGCETWHEANNAQVGSSGYDQCTNSHAHPDSPIPSA